MTKRVVTTNERISRFRMPFHQKIAAIVIKETRIIYKENILIYKKFHEFSFYEVNRNHLNADLLSNSFVNFQSRTLFST